MGSCSLDFSTRAAQYRQSDRKVTSLRKSGAGGEFPEEVSRKKFLTQSKVECVTKKQLVHFLSFILGISKLKARGTRNIS